MTIVFCLPGRQYSGRFLECWSDLLVSCVMKGISPLMRREYTSNVYLSRNLILKPDILFKGFRCKDVQVLSGSHYDYLMWIDSDAVFDPGKLWRLLDHDVDICGGSAITNMEQGKLSWGFYDPDGSCNFSYKQDVERMPRDSKGLISVDFTGFHWLLMKRGVMEKLEYPWFRPTTKLVGDLLYFPSEDIGWSDRIKDAGLQILIDPECKIGHEKPVTLVA